ncbi:UNVERIFIED_CONTAM: hypothetical protein GTU68_061129 [Idotea baltica]|nr:hypothetical protein [Idotea baltica]
MVNFSLVQLEYIVALDTHRHFVNAAEHCSVTQPTLSMQIKKMEEVLGVVIFDRSKHPLIPTDAGIQIISQARQVLAEARKIPEIVTSYQDTIEGTLRLGIIPTLSPYLLPRFIGDFTTKYPLVDLHVHELTTNNVVQELQKDSLDAGLIITPLEQQGIVERPLFYEEILAYLSSDQHPSSGSAVTALDLQNGPLWMLTEGNCFREQVFNICALQEKGERSQGFTFESGSLETLRRLVDAEGGATLLPELAATDIPERRKAQLHPIGPQRACREVSLVYSRAFSKQRLIGLLEDSIQKAVTLPNKIPKDFSLIRWR